MLKPCSYPACPALIHTGSYCQAHAGHHKARHGLYDRFRRQVTPELAEAARIRSSQQWRRVRKSQLAREPLCFDPFSDHERRGVTATAAQVHHIRPLTTHPELAFHGSNLMSVCTACHAKLSVEERAGE